MTGCAGGCPVVVLVVVVVVAVAVAVVAVILIDYIYAQLFPTT